MKTPFIIIGQAPAEHGDPTAPLEGRVGRKLADLLGCTYEEYLKRSQRFNILPEWPGRDKGRKGDRFPMFVAKQNASRMSYSFGGCTVLYLGVKVGQVFGFHDEPLKWKSVAWPAGQTHKAAVLPHPSGINRWWNDHKNKHAAKQFMTKLGRLI